MDKTKLEFKISTLYSTMYLEVITEEMYHGNSFKTIGTGSMICVIYHMVL